MVDINDNQTIDIEEAIATETNHQNMMEIQKIYGDDRPYNEELVIQEALFYRQQSLESVLEFGKRLVYIKENTNHGHFTKILNDRFDMEPRAAQKIMQACVKLSNASLTTHLIQAAKNKTKLFELMILDDTELEELSKGGTVAGIELSDVEKMTASQLRKALKDAKADQDAVRKVSADKDKKINDLSEKLEKAEAKAKKETEKLKLDESETDRLIKSYKLTLAEITGDILASNSKLQQLYAQAVNDNLPNSFLQDFARELLSVRQNFELIAEDLPSDDGIVDTTWMDKA